MSDGRWIHETIDNLLLCDNANGILAADGHHREPRIGGFKAIFHLVQTTLRRENGNVVIIVAVVNGTRAKRRDEGERKYPDNNGGSLLVDVFSYKIGAKVPFRLILTSLDSC